MQQQPGGGQFGGSSQSNYYLPTPSPYQQQQGTPMTSFAHSPGSAVEPSSGSGVYSSMHQQQQQQPLSTQPLYQYMTPSPAQQSELSRQLGFGSAPPSVGSPMAAGSGSGFRSQPPSLQPHMLPPTPQPPTPRAGPQTPASVGQIGSVGGGDYGAASIGGPGSVNPATPRSVGEPLSVSDQQQQQMMMATKGATMGNASFTALLDQDSNSQIDSPQSQQQQTQASSAGVQQQQQQAMGISGRSGVAMPSSLSSQNLVDVSGSSVAAGGRGPNVSGNLAGSAALSLQNSDHCGPLALCSMGKELTQELVNRTVDMFMLLRALTDPNQQFPKMATPETVPQLYEKEKRLHDNLRHTAALIHRLMAICTRLEQLSKDRLPPDAQDRVKELLPYLDECTKPVSENGDHMEADKKASYLEEVRTQAERREEFQSIRAEHDKTKQELMKKREHLRRTMEFLRDFCWQMSMVLDSNASSA